MMRYSGTETFIWRLIVAGFVVVVVVQAGHYFGWWTL